jgi:hypothetical protein
VKRRLFNLLAAVCLILCAATCWLWYLSYDESDAFGSTREHSPLVAQANGSIILGLGSFEDEGPGHRRVLDARAIDRIDDLTSLYIYGTDLAWSCGRGGFYLAVSAPFTDAQRRNWCVVFPHCALLGVLAVTPLAWLANAGLRWRRRATHRCTRCGYDLRATPQRCPECGTPTKA